MTSEAFRRMVLRLPGVVEGSHMRHPDFRAGGKIFASLADEDARLAMVKVTPELQESLVDAAPDVFKPCAGMWGMGGATYIHLKSAKSAMVTPAVRAAFDLVTASIKSPKPRAKHAKPARRVRRNGPGGT